MLDGRYAPLTRSSHFCTSFSYTNFASSREAFSNLKNEFIKVVLGINTFVYDKKYSSGLSGFSKALAKGISLFIDKCFEQREEFDLIDKCEIDNQIKENMQLFVEQTKERNYYER